MTRRCTGSVRLAGSVFLLSLLCASAQAGDEDISPSPYQEFDPVTGYMVTVDPAKDQKPGHGQAPDESAAEPSSAMADDDSGVNWLQIGLAVAAITAAAGLLSRRRRTQAGSGRWRR